MKAKICPTCGGSGPFYRGAAKCKECHKRRVREQYHAARTPAAAAELDALTRKWGRP